MSEDEYDAYNDFAGLTEEDFALLDANSLAGLTGLPQPPQDPAGPSISIEVEEVQLRVEKPSPIRQYRWSGTLSVTDLISLAWCVPSAVLCGERPVLNGWC
jgi:exonuclease V